MKKFLYFLMDSDGRYLTVRNGVFAAVNTPTPLINTPDGWQAKTLAWERDMKLLGMVRQLSLPFGFVKGGAMMLRHALLSWSIEKDISLVIAMLETQVDLVAGTYNHVYRKLYKGEIDNTSIKSSALKVEANITEGGLHKLINANRATQYEFPLSEGDAIVKMDGINLQQKGAFLITDSNGNYRQNHFLDVAFLNKEGESAGAAFLSQMGGQVPPSYDYNSGDNYFLITTQAIDGVRIQGTVNLIPNHGGGAYTLYLWRTSIGAVTLATINNPVGLVTIPFDITLNAAAGEKFYLNASRTGSGSDIVSYRESQLSVSITSKYRASYVKAFTPALMFRKLIKAITGKEGNTISTLLDQYSHYKLTSGDGLRALNGAKVKMSLDSFLEFCNVVLFAGMGIEKDKVVIEAKEYFISAANPVNLGPAKDLVITEATDLLFNTIRVGYSPVQTDDVNGKYSFNNTLSFKTAITKVTKELTLICPFISDPFVIELTRINLEGKTTTDSTKDNQVFILDAVNKTYTDTIYAEKIGSVNYLNLNDLSRIDNYVAGSKITISNAVGLNGTYTILSALLLTGVIQLTVTEDVPTNVFTNAVISLSLCDLYRDSAVTITGVPDPATIFNWRLSPKRILLKWLPWINSILWKEAGSKLTFLTTDKNADFKTIENGITIEEKANLTVGDSRLFINLDISFENIVPTNLSTTLEDTPNRGLSTEWEGVTISGILRKAAMAPSDEKPQTFRILAHATNDLKTLIHE